MLSYCHRTCVSVNTDAFYYDSFYQQATRFAAFSPCVDPLWQPPHGKHAPAYIQRQIGLVNSSTILIQLFCHHLCAMC